ncbi:YcxB family protein [Humibacter sp.]|uniref:YcxB family protein n=1 Tax=Humibacter sp. TaxID=1940291 RepID=UPI003F7DBB66
MLQFWKESSTVTISVSEGSDASISSFEGSITIDAADQDAAARAISHIYRSPRSRRIWMVIPGVLLLAWLMLSPLKLVAAFLLAFYLGTLTTAIYVWTRAAINAHRTLPAAVREQYPLGEELSLRADPDGFTVTSPQVSSRVAWTMISTVQRIEGGIVLRGRSKQPLFIWPGRVLTDEAVSGMNTWVKAR